MNEGGETRLQRLHVGLILKNRATDTSITNVDKCEKDNTEIQLGHFERLMMKYVLGELQRNTQSKGVTLDSNAVLLSLVCKKIFYQQQKR